MIEIIDPGHKYKLLTLDGELNQTLQFVKRCDVDNPSKFPGNTNSYPGTTLQSVLRACIDRVKYLNNQIPCAENLGLLHNLELSLWLLEKRAAKRHGFNVDDLDFSKVIDGPMCSKCGHTFCHCKKDVDK